MWLRLSPEAPQHEVEQSLGLGERFGSMLGDGGDRVGEFEKIGGFHVLSDHASFLSGGENHLGPFSDRGAAKLEKF